MNDIHELKILPMWFNAVVNENKNFEIRKNDRDYKVGDMLILKEWNNGEYTGREVWRQIQYIYYGNGEYGLDKEYCILGVR